MACKKGTTFAMRFWAKVDKDGPVPEHAPYLGQCWVWIAGRNALGYGTFAVRRHSQLAHRVSWLMHGGSITPEAPCVLHACDNPSCVRPNHLWAGTRLENAQDRERKGRGSQPTGDRNGSRKWPERRPRGERMAALVRGTIPKGEANYNAKLTANDVLAIRVLIADGETQGAIARKFGVGQTCISKIHSGVSWSHLDKVEGALEQEASR